MDTCKLKQTRLQQEIFRLFCLKTGEKLSQRQIAEALNVTPTAVAKALHLLEQNKLLLVKRNKIMNLNLVELNRENKNTINFKKVENLKLFYESEILSFLNEKHPSSTIILFGSYAKGEDLINSDIDIAVIGSKKKNLNLGKYEQMLNKKININYYKNFTSINQELKENLYNGIILTGGIEL